MSEGIEVMLVFCNECGKSVPEGSKFCLNCGSQLPTVPLAASPPPNAAPPPPNEPQPQKKGGGAFFSSPAGIALVVILAIAVIGGLTLGIIFLVKGDSNNTVDAETVKVWDEYESMLTDNSTNVPKITMDQNALAQAQADLKKTQDRVATLEKVLKETGGTQARRSGKIGNNTRDIKADQMAAALVAYNLYVQKMNELFITLIGANLLDQNVVNKLNQILSELQKLGANVKVISEKFLANNKQVTTVTIDAPVLSVAKTFEADIQKNVTAAQTAEQQRLAVEKAAADTAAQQAAAAAEKQKQAQLVTCPNCGGVGTVEGGDGRYTCGFCNGTGQVTQSKAAAYNPADWRDY